MELKYTAKQIIGMWKVSNEEMQLYNIPDNADIAQALQLDIDSGLFYKVLSTKAVYDLGSYMSAASLLDAATPHIHQSNLKYFNYKLQTKRRS
jgi:hypothetical protein